MKIFRSRPFVLAIVVVGALLIMALDTVGRVTPLGDAIYGAIAPLTVTLTNLREAADNVVQTARDLRTLRRRNAELELLVQRLTVENLQLSEVAIENERLRAFLDFAQTNPTYDLRGGQIIARVIADSASPYADIAQIDLGEKHGIRPGMPVVTDRGLVGRIVQVRSTTSEVLLLTDPNSAVNVMTTASRAPGVLNGRAGQLPLMDLIPPDVEILGRGDCHHIGTGWELSQRHRSRPGHRTPAKRQSDVPTGRHPSDR